MRRSAYGLKFDPQVHGQRCRHPARAEHLEPQDDAAQARCSCTARTSHSFPQLRLPAAGRRCSATTWAAVAAAPRQRPTASMKSAINQNFTAGVSETSPTGVDRRRRGQLPGDRRHPRRAAATATPSRCGTWRSTPPRSPPTRTMPRTGCRQSGPALHQGRAPRRNCSRRSTPAPPTRQAGWPNCEQLLTAAPGCATCPLFAYSKSPFHHAAPPSRRSRGSQHAGRCPLPPAQATTR